MNNKRETITITFVGNKKFKQFVINRIAELLNGEYFAEKVAKPGCGITLTSSIEPSEEE